MINTYNIQKRNMNTNIKEYNEGYGVEIIEHDGDPVGIWGPDPTKLEHPERKGRLVIGALNEGGYNSTQVDLLDVIAWVKENRPDLLK